MLRRLVKQTSTGEAPTLACKIRTPRSQIAAILREGWLLKRGGSHGGKKNWKRRYFFLTPSGLYYFEDAQSSHSLGLVALLPTALASSTEVTERPHAFSVCSPDMEPFLLAAGDAVERLEWMEAISSACMARACSERDQDHRRRATTPVTIGAPAETAAAKAAAPEAVELQRTASLKKGAAAVGEAVQSSKMSRKVKHLVSKKKRRFVEDGFDLDLSYITPRLISMGFPSTGKEALYRNPATQARPRTAWRSHHDVHSSAAPQHAAHFLIWQVRAFLERYHAGHAKVYNTCAERRRKYEAEVIGLPAAQLEHAYIAHDHNPCALALIEPFCQAAPHRPNRALASSRLPASRHRTSSALLCQSLGAWLDADSAHVGVIHCKAGKGRAGTFMCACLPLFHLRHALPA